jgi:hypothetical protein
MADALAGAADHFDQEPQFGRDAVVLALLLDQVLGKADTFDCAHGFFRSSLK